MYQTNSIIEFFLFLIIANGLRKDIRLKYFLKPYVRAYTIHTYIYIFIYTTYARQNKILVLLYSSVCEGFFDILSILFMSFNAGSRIIYRRSYRVCTWRHVS